MVKIENRTGTVICSHCKEETDFEIVWNGSKGFVLKGAALPFSDGMKVELGRRQAAALCGPCWRMKERMNIPRFEVFPPPEPEKPKILTGDDA